MYNFSIIASYSILQMLMVSINCDLSKKKKKDFLLFFFYFSLFCFNIHIQNEWNKRKGISTMLTPSTPAHNIIKRRIK